MPVSDTKIIVEGLPMPDSWVYDLWQSDAFKGFWPERGERRIETNTVWLDHDIIHDGGGPALAAYRYGLCPFV